MKSNRWQLSSYRFIFLYGRVGMDFRDIELIHLIISRFVSTLPGAPKILFMIPNTSNYRPHYYLYTSPEISIKQKSLQIGISFNSPPGGSHDYAIAAIICASRTRFRSCFRLNGNIY
jgi:hypothetical protein